MTAAGRSATIATMRRVSRSSLSRLGGALVPWLVAIFLVLVAGDELGPDPPAGARPLASALAVVQGVALHWRRRRPEAATAIVLAAGLGYQLIVPEIVLPIAGFFAIGALAAERPPRVSLVGLAGLLAPSATNFFTTTVGDTTFTMGLAIGAWSLGEAARTRRATIEETARRAASDERARVARELHDVIAHSVSVIVVQAAAADDVFDERPDQARTALRAIEATGRDALAELRRLLGAVRGDDHAAGPAQPQPGLERLDELAAPLRAGGLEVVVRREGPAAALPAGIELSAYRIVQEALTNTLRHARATRAEVTLRYGPDALEVDVRDDGRAGAGDDAGAGPGRGLAGMRERAALLGGTLDAGALPRGGFRVHARLPLEAAP
jgi:signal transduction histidine kinase